MFFISVLTVASSSIVFSVILIGGEVKLVWDNLRWLLKVDFLNFSLHILRLPIQYLI